MKPENALDWSIPEPDRWNIECVLARIPYIVGSVLYGQRTWLENPRGMRN
jgi:hypothetical protein